jgi:hypothetical protein
MVATDVASRGIGMVSFLPRDLFLTFVDFLIYSSSALLRDLNCALHFDLVRSSRLLS